MYRLLSLLIIFTFVVSCSQPDNKDKNTEEKTDSKEISEKPAEVEKTVVAKVNDIPIYNTELDNNLQNPLKEAIVYQVLLQEAKRKGFYDGDLVVGDLSDPTFKREFLGKRFAGVQAMRRDILQNVNVNKKVTDQEINDYYNKNINKYTYVKTLKYTVQSDEATTNKVREQLAGGASVNDIRDEFGDTDFKILVEEKKLTNEPLVLDSFDVIEVGAIGKPIRFAGNFDIFKITEVKKVDTDKIKTALKQNIKSTRKQDAIYKYVDNQINSGNYNVSVLEGDQ